MAYPQYIEASLLEIDGNSCGSLSHTLELDTSGSTPEYNLVSGAGDFDYATAWRVTPSGGSTTWRMRIYYTGGGSCNGFHDFIRKTAADDPTGDYCILASDGSPDCSAGKASCSETFL